MSENNRDIKAIGIDMVIAGLPYAFVLRVIELARESEGVDDLVHLWASAPSVGAQGEIEADLYEAIEDRETSVESPRTSSADDCERLLGGPRDQKEHLRELVEQHGGVAEVARRAEMPQASLGRILGSTSEPKLTTLKRLAKAMDVPLSTVLGTDLELSRKLSSVLEIQKHYLNGLDPEWDLAPEKGSDWSNRMVPLWEEDECLRRDSTAPHLFEAVLALTGKEPSELGDRIDRDDEGDCIDDLYAGGWVLRQSYIGSAVLRVAKRKEKSG